MIRLSYDAQFDLRKGKSTVDALVCLLNLVQKYLNESKRLYCVFVDLKMAYDCIHTHAMLLKLYKLCINGNMLRIVENRICMQRLNLVYDRVIIIYSCSSMQ